MRFRLVRALKATHSGVRRRGIRRNRKRSALRAAIYGLRCCHETIILRLVVVQRTHRANRVLAPVVLKVPSPVVARVGFAV